MSVTHWIIVLVIVLLVFGTSRLKTIGSDLGSAVKGFKKAMEDSESKETKQLLSQKEKDADFHTTPDQSAKNDKSEHKS